MGLVVCGWFGCLLLYFSWKKLKKHLQLNNLLKMLISIVLKMLVITDT